MRQFVLVALLLLSFSANGQKGIVSECQGRQLYTCVSTRLSVEAEKLKPGSIDLMTDNGTIEPIKGEPGEYWIKPEREGKVGVYIRQWYTKQVARNDSVNFWASQLPIQNSFFGIPGGKKGAVSKYQLCWFPANPGAYASDGGCIDEMQYAIDHVDLSITRGSEEIYRRSATRKESAIIDCATSDFFFSLQNYDKITLTNISVKYCGSDRKLDPIEVTVVDAEKFRDIPEGDTVIVVNPVTEQEEMHVRRKCQ